MTNQEHLEAIQSACNRFVPTEKKSLIAIAQVVVDCFVQCGVSIGFILGSLVGCDRDLFVYSLVNIAPENSYARLALSALGER